ncbi:MAG: metallophosphoesterase [Planctomycetota bacterium]|jgi:predicted MPP superfamily phosphohydrolase
MSKADEVRTSPWSRRRFLKLAVASGVAAAAGGGYVYRSNRLTVSRERWTVPGWKGGPVRITAISDLHAPGYGPTEELRRVIAKENPDMLVVAGDMVEREGGQNAIEPFAEVEAHAGKFAVMGNWDYWSGISKSNLKRSLSKGGFSLLVNETHETDSLVVVGLDDYLAGVPKPSMVEGGGEDGKPVLVLSHCPALFDKLPAGEGRPLLMLSGHTHGGQIAPAGFTPYVPRGSGPFVKGWYRRGERSLYVMRGVGNTIVPLRIGARPEVLSLTIVPG